MQHLCGSSSDEIPPDDEGHECMKNDLIFAPHSVYLQVPMRNLMASLEV